MPVYFHTEIPDFKVPRAVNTKQWLKTVFDNEAKRQGTLNYIFCDDEKVLSINNQYLKHDYYTDIITFDTSGDDGKVSGDIYISIDRVKDNADEYKVAFDTELRRVLVHGVLHLMGYKDKTKAQIKEMRQKEDFYLQLFDLL